MFSSPLLQIKAYILSKRTGNKTRLIFFTLHQRPLILIYNVGVGSSDFPQDNPQNSSRYIIKIMKVVRPNEHSEDDVNSTGSIYLCKSP